MYSHVYSSPPYLPMDHEGNHAMHEPTPPLFPYVPSVRYQVPEEGSYHEITPADHSTLLAGSSYGQYTGLYHPRYGLPPPVDAGFGSLGGGSTVIHSFNRPYSYSACEIAGYREPSSLIPNYQSSLASPLSTTSAHSDASSETVSPSSYQSSLVMPKTADPWLYPTDPYGQIFSAAPPGAVDCSNVNPTAQGSCISFETFQTPSQLLASLQCESAIDYGAMPPTTSEPAKEHEGIKRSETLRQARRRFVAESVGFEPTDPDSLSCHDKKRGYLECLEEYVIWLREQCQLARVKPPEINRVPKYSGMANQSTRTMIVHMENVLRKCHENTLREEAEFLSLRDQVLSWEAEQAAERGVGTENVADIKT